LLAAETGTKSMMFLNVSECAKKRSKVIKKTAEIKMRIWLCFFKEHARNNWQNDQNKQPILI
jgi:hypothetical protein